MDILTILTTLVSHLSPRVDAAVRVSGMEDERPLPLVLINDWSATDFDIQNTGRAGRAEDPADGVEKEWRRFYYSLRVDMEIRHEDEVEVHALLGDVRGVLFDLKESPLDFHPHVNSITPRGAGGINHQFIEPKEEELSQAVVIDTFLQTTKDPANYDTLLEMFNDITIKD